MSQKVELKLDWATHEAAKYACENWHYSRCIPPNKSVKIGVWEFGHFVGVIVFGMGATPYLCRPYNLQMTEVCELTRVALKSHRSSVTRIISIAIKFLKKQSPGLRLIISFADTNQGHHGGIYQGGNWIYSGMTKPAKFLMINNSVVHPRQVTRLKKRADPILIKAKDVVMPGKYRYLMPLDDQMKNQIELLRKPYPKRAVSIANDVPGDHPGEGGATPTTALQNNPMNHGKVD